MFTGLIEEIGQIKSISNFDGGLQFEIEATTIMDDLTIDDSVSIEGACQTVVAVNQNSFTIQSIKETLDKTTFNQFFEGQSVNLERAMRAGDRLGGHFVQGHVNGIAALVSIEDRGENRLLGIKLDQELLKYCIKEGSIAVNGVSLTIADIKSDVIYISVIPHTMKMTTLSGLKPGDQVNIEVDMLAKYVYKFQQKY